MVNDKIVLRMFSENLNKRMEQKGVTYRQVAFAARVTKGCLVHYKSGNSFPELWTLVLMASYLDCSVDGQLGYSDLDTSFSSTRLIKPLMDEDYFDDYFRECLMNMMNSKNVDIFELSDRSGVSKNYIEMYLSIHRWVPRVPDFLAICDALECTPSDLLGY